MQTSNQRSHPEINSVILSGVRRKPNAVEGPRARVQYHKPIQEFSPRTPDQSLAQTTTPSFALPPRPPLPPSLPSPRSTARLPRHAPSPSCGSPETAPPQPLSPHFSLPAPDGTSAAASWQSKESRPADSPRPSPRCPAPNHAPALITQPGLQYSPTPASPAIRTRRPPGPTKYRQTCFP